MDRTYKAGERVDANLDEPCGPGDSGKIYRCKNATYFLLGCLEGALNEDTMQSASSYVIKTMAIRQASLLLQHSLNKLFALLKTTKEKGESAWGSENFKVREAECLDECHGAFRAFGAATRKWHLQPYVPFSTLTVWKMRVKAALSASAHAAAPFLTTFRVSGTTFHANAYDIETMDEYLKGSAFAEELIMTDAWVPSRAVGDGDYQCWPQPQKNVSCNSCHYSYPKFTVCSPPSTAGTASESLTLANFNTATRNNASISALIVVSWSLPPVVGTHS